MHTTTKLKEYKSPLIVSDKEFQPDAIRVISSCLCYPTGPMVISNLAFLDENVQEAGEFKSYFLIDRNEFLALKTKKLEETNINDLSFFVSQTPERQFFLRHIDREFFCDEILNLVKVFQKNKNLFEDYRRGWMTSPNFYSTVPKMMVNEILKAFDIDKSRITIVPDIVHTITHGNLDFGYFQSPKCVAPDGKYVVRVDYALLHIFLTLVCCFNWNKEKCKDNPEFMKKHRDGIMKLLNFYADIDDKTLFVSLDHILRQIEDVRSLKCSLPHDSSTVTKNPFVGSNRNPITRDEYHSICTNYGLPMSSNGIIKPKNLAAVIRMCLLKGWAESFGAVQLQNLILRSFFKTLVMEDYDKPTEKLIRGIARVGEPVEPSEPKSAPKQDPKEFQTLDLIREAWDTKIGNPKSTNPKLAETFKKVVLGTIFDFYHKSDCKDLKKRFHERLEAYSDKDEELQMTLYFGEIDEKTELSKESSRIYEQYLVYLNKLAQEVSEGVIQVSEAIKETENGFSVPFSSKNPLTDEYLQTIWDREIKQFVSPDPAHQDFQNEFRNLIFNNLKAFFNYDVAIDINKFRGDLTRVSQINNFQTERDIAMKILDLCEIHENVLNIMFDQISGIQKERLMEAQGSIKYTRSSTSIAPIPKPITRSDLEEMWSCKFSLDLPSQYQNLHEKLKEKIFSTLFAIFNDRGEISSETFRSDLMEIALADPEITAKDCPSMCHIHETMIVHLMKSLEDYTVNLEPSKPAPKAESTDSEEEDEDPFEFILKHTSIGSSTKQSPMSTEDSEEQEPVTETLLQQVWDSKIRSRLNPDFKFQELQEQLRQKLFSAVFSVFNENLDLDDSQFLNDIKSIAKPIVKGKKEFKRAELNKFYEQQNELWSDFLYEVCMTQQPTPSVAQSEPSTSQQIPENVTIKLIEKVWNLVIGDPTSSNPIMDAPFKKLVIEAVADSYDNPTSECFNLKLAKYCKEDVVFRESLYENDVKKLSKEGSVVFKKYAGYYHKVAAATMDIYRKRVKEEAISKEHLQQIWSQQIKTDPKPELQELQDEFRDHIFITLHSIFNDHQHLNEKVFFTAIQDIALKSSLPELEVSLMCVRQRIHLDVMMEAIKPGSSKNVPLITREALQYIWDNKIKFHFPCNPKLQKLQDRFLAKMFTRYLEASNSEAEIDFKEFRNDFRQIARMDPLMRNKAMRGEVLRLCDLQKTILDAFVKESLKWKHQNDDELPAKRVKISEETTVKVQRSAEPDPSTSGSSDKEDQAINFPKISKPRSSLFPSRLVRNLTKTRFIATRRSKPDAPYKPNRQSAKKGTSNRMDQRESAACLKCYRTSRHCAVFRGKWNRATKRVKLYRMKTRELEKRIEKMEKLPNTLATRIAELEAELAQCQQKVLELESAPRIHSDPPETSDTCSISSDRISTSECSTTVENLSGLVEKMQIAVKYAENNAIQAGKMRRMEEEMERLRKLLEEKDEEIEDLKINAPSTSSDPSQELEKLREQLLKNTATAGILEMQNKILIEKTIEQRQEVVELTGKLEKTRVNEMTHAEVQALKESEHNKTLELEELKKELGIARVQNSKNEETIRNL